MFDSLLPIAAVADGELPLRINVLPCRFIFEPLLFRFGVPPD